MIVSLKGKVKTNIIINYSPYSSQKVDTERHFEKLQEIYDDIPNREFTCIIGDFNCELTKNNTWELRRKHKLTGEPFFNNHSHIASTQYRAQVEDHAKILVDFCAKNQLAIPASCMQDQKDREMITFSKFGLHNNAPFTPIRYSTIDYVLTNKKWCNAFDHCCSDMKANINSDHFPIIAKCKRRFTKKTQSDRWH